MISAIDRLAVSAMTLAVIDQRRKETRQRGLGAGLERFIIGRELRELEEEVLLDPGPLESLLVRTHGVMEDRRF